MNVVLSDKRVNELVHTVVQGIRALILLVASDSSNREINARVLIVDAIDGFSIFQSNKKVIAIATKQLLNNSEFLGEVQSLIDQKISKRNTIASSKIEERRRQRRSKLFG
jgi:hypothetical protein